MIAGAALLASCGRPDRSGVYLATSGRSATLIRLAQDQDGAVTGRVETIAMGADGVVSDDSTSLDAAAAKQALAFKGDAVTLSRNGAVVQARKRSLADFQKAVAHLKREAELQRHNAAEAQPQQAARIAEASAFDAAPDKAAKLRDATAELRADAARLNDAVSQAPDFGRQAADNTARLAAMAQQAQALPRSGRRALAASANQALVGSNQIDVARTRYAIDLDRTVARAAPLATAVERFCEGPGGSSYASACAEAVAAATGFESALVHAATVFKGYKQTVQTEIARQTELMQKIGG